MKSLITSFDIWYFSGSLIIYAASVIPAAMLFVSFSCFLQDNMLIPFVLYLFELIRSRKYTPKKEAEQKQASDGD